MSRDFSSAGIAVASILSSIRPLMACSASRRGGHRAQDGGEAAVVLQEVDAGCGDSGELHFSTAR